MTKELLISVVDDDHHFRESMRRLMRSMGFTADGFASAGDFLTSPRLAETAVDPAALAVDTDDAQVARHSHRLGREQFHTALRECRSRQEAANERRQKMAQFHGHYLHREGLTTSKE